MWTLLFSFLFTLSGAQAAAGVLGLKVEKFNLEYAKPFGKGDVQKIHLSFSMKSPGPYPVELRRTDKDFELTSAFADLTWQGPWGFVHDVDKITLKEANLEVGKNKHGGSAAFIATAPKGMGTFIFRKAILNCSGQSTDSSLENRLMDDCREKLELKVDSLEVPLNFFMAQIVADYPQEDLGVFDIPAKNLVMMVDKGEFSLKVYTKVIFNAGLRATGTVTFEKGHKEILIQVKQIKFGYIPLTTIVMKELRKRVKHPDVIITGNTIRVKL